MCECQIANLSVWFALALLFQPPDVWNVFPAERHDGFMFPLISCQSCTCSPYNHAPGLTGVTNAASASNRLRPCRPNRSVHGVIILHLCVSCSVSLNFLRPRGLFIIQCNSRFNELQLTFGQIKCPRPSQFLLPVSFPSKAFSPPCFIDLCESD